MTRAERREKLRIKFKKRLKYWANVGYYIKNPDSEQYYERFRKAIAWDQLKGHYEFRDQASPCKESAWKIYNTKHKKKEAFKRVQEQLEEVNMINYKDFIEDEIITSWSDFKVNVKSRFSDIKDKNYGL